MAALTLVQLCVKSSALLHEAISGINSTKRDVQYMKAEAEDLNIVLQALERHIEEATDNLEVLKLVLQQCRQVCEDFREAVLEALGSPEDRLQGLKAWVKLQHRSSDIENFRRLIGSYKATMTIALADSNLQTSKVTKQLLSEYTEMTKKAALNLEEQIEELGAKLELLQSEQRHPSSDGQDTQSKDDFNATKQTLDRKTSLEQCLSVCQQLLDHVEKIRPAISEDAEGATASTSVCDVVEEVTVLAPRITANALEMCTQNLNTTVQHLRALQEGSQSKSKLDKARIMQELDSAQRCLNIVKVAQQHRVNTFESIDTAEDSCQAVVSTMGDLIKASDLTIGARSMNIMGQMSDETVQKITTHFRLTAPERPPSMETGTNFEQKHGFGHTIRRGRQ